MKSLSRFCPVCVAYRNADELVGKPISGRYSGCVYCQPKAKTKVKKAPLGRRIQTIFTHSNRARIYGDEGKIIYQEWEDLKEKYNHACLCCGRREPEVEITLDHVLPLSMGGSNTIDNAQPLCLSCNCKKSTKYIDYRPKN